VIVMLGCEVENGREKCFPYWPDQSPVELPDLSVFCDSFTQTAQLISRTFTISSRKESTSRPISHFQYIAWPDQGLPATADGFTKLMESVDSVNTGNPPIVVHCSAGIGRTGTFCVVHCTLTKLKYLLTTQYPLSLSLQATVLRMRDHRTGIVQTMEQYKFCYISLLDKVKEILNVIEYKNERWFYPHMDANQAAQQLQKKPEGTFLFRSNGSGPYIALSIANKKEIIHTRVTVTEKGFQLDGESYQTLSELVEKRRQILKYPLQRK